MLEPVKLTVHVVFDRAGQMTPMPSREWRWEARDLYT